MPHDRAAPCTGCSHHFSDSCLCHTLINHSFLLFFLLKRTDIFIGYFLPSEIPEDFPLARITGALNMPWTDAQAPGPESLYCPRGSDAHSEPGARLSEVGPGHFPVAGGVAQEADCCWHAPCRVLSELLVMWEPLDISPCPRSHPRTWCSHFEVGWGGCKW